MKTFDTKNLNEMSVVYGKKCRESKSGLGHAPILFYQKSIGSTENSLAINLKSSEYKIQVGSWPYDSLYDEDPYIVVPKELA